MDEETKPKPLPEKVVRRHADMLGELLPEITRLVVEEGRPADGLLSHHLRAHKELGSRDRRFLSQAVFSYFRWYGWTVNKLGLPVTEACLLGAALDCTEMSDSFKYLEGRCSLPHPVEPLGAKGLAEKAGTNLTDYYANVLRALGQQPGLLGDIFSGALSRFNKPTNLKKLLLRPTSASPTSRTPCGRT